MSETLEIYDFSWCSMGKGTDMLSTGLVWSGLVRDLFHVAGESGNRVDFDRSMFGPATKDRQHPSGDKS